MSTFLGLVNALLPELAASLERIRGLLDTPESPVAIAEEYRGLPSVSVDYGIMEHIDSAFVVPARFGWDDVGSWSFLERIVPRDAAGNAVRGAFVGIDTANVVVQADRALVAAVGVRDLVIVETADAILVCARDRTQDVRKVVAELKRRGMESYL